MSDPRFNTGDPIMDAALAADDAKLEAMGAYDEDERFGGMELPEDIVVLCDRHNALAEAEHPTRDRNYSR